MTVDIIVYFIQILSFVLLAAIIIRALLSWFAPGGAAVGGLSRVLLDITEPVLSPIRRTIPPVGGIDFSPIVALILIQLASYVLTTLVTSTI